jgi:hypothetical protein
MDASAIEQYWVPWSDAAFVCPTFASFGEALERDGRYATAPVAKNIIRAASTWHSA